MLSQVLILQLPILVVDTFLSWMGYNLQDFPMG